MDQNTLENLKQKLLQLKTQILNSGPLTNKADLKISEEDLSDEGDIASNIMNQEVSVSIREKELNKLRQVELALQRMEEHTYGQCSDCGDEIEAKRLDKQPWTSLCIVHAEEREREDQRFQRRA